MKANAAQSNEFAKVWAQPTEDVAPPVPVMQNVGMAFLSDAIGFASSAASIYSGFKTP